MSNPLHPLPPAGTSIPYVILHHTGIPRPHYDLLLHLPSAPRLPTWRTPNPPNQWPPPATERIADHRPVYLTYEGPLSNDRGTVARVGHGTALILATTPLTATLRLTGTAACDITLPLNPDSSAR